MPRRSDFSRYVVRPRARIGVAVVAPAISAGTPTSSTLPITISGGSGITSLTAEINDGGGWATDATLATNATSHTYSGLTASTSYDVRLNVNSGAAYSNVLTMSTGSSSEHVGTYADLDLEVYEIYRLNMAAGEYPTWTTSGATHTHEAAGSWDGGPCAKLTPPNAAVDDGYSSTGGYSVDNGGTFSIHKLNIRWEFTFGSTFVTNFGESVDLKWVIVHTANTLGGSTNERPMMNWQRESGQNTFQIAVGAGTIKQFNPTAPPDNLGPDYTNAEFLMGPTTTTLGGVQVIGAGTWLSVEMEVIAESSAEAPDGRIRVVVVDRSGTTLTDFEIPWDYDGAWNTLPRYITEVQLIGGFYNDTYASTDTNTYQKISGVTFAANRAGLLGPRSGFVV